MILSEAHYSVCIASCLLLQLVPTRTLDIDYRDREEMKYHGDGIWLMWVVGQLTICYFSLRTEHSYNTKLI